MISQKLQSLVKTIFRRPRITWFNTSPNLDLDPPYAYVQNITEKYIHKYLGVKPEQIESWCIVGGFLADEAIEILNNYPKAHVTIFECSKRYIDNLSSRYRNNKRVKIVHKGASNSKETVTFYENSLSGTGSLLKPGKFLKENYDINQAESYQVETITLDEYFDGKTVDILQIDVQGAEKLVLEGASELLKRTKACFIEISVNPDLYEGSCIFDELYNMLKQNGFVLALLGTDFNLTGNALFLNMNKTANPKKLW